MADSWTDLLAERERVMSAGAGLTVLITHDMKLRVHDPRIDSDRTPFVAVNMRGHRWIGRSDGINADYPNVLLFSSVFPNNDGP